MANVNGFGMPYQRYDEIARDGSWPPAAVARCRPWYDGQLPVDDYGSWSPIVTITSEVVILPTARLSLPDLRISAFTNPGELTDLSSMRKIGELVLTGRGTSGLDIEVNLAERKVRYRENTGSNFEGWVDGSRLIGRSVEAGLRKWWSVQPCDHPVIAVSPVYTSMFNAAVQTNATQIQYWVTIDLVNRFGCC